MTKIARFFIPLAVLMAVAGSAFAETKWRFEVFGAALTPLSKNFEIVPPQSTVTLSGTQQFSFGGRGGVRVGADVKGHWGQDFIYSYGSNATKIVNQSNSAQFEFTSRTHQFSYNGLWYPGGNAVGKESGAFPYLTAGVGGTFHVLSQAAVNAALDPNRGGLGALHNENVLDFNAGGGVLFRMSSRFGIRIDARDFMSRAVRYGLPQASSDPNATVFPISGVFQRIEASVAFVIYF